MKSNLTKWFRTVEIFVRKFFGSMMQVHSEDVVDGWTSSWSLYRWGTDKHRAWQACCRVSCERCKGKFVLMFPVSRYSWKRMYLYLHPNCMVQYTWKWDTTLVVFAIQTSSFWTASYLMYTVVSIISILYIHVFNISQKSTRNWGEWRCLRSFMWLWNPIFGQRIRVHHMHWRCCDGIRLWRSSREFHRPGRLVKSGQTAQDWGKMDSQAEASLLVYLAQRNIPRYTLWLMKLRMLMGSHSSSSQEVRWLTTKRFVCKTSLDFIAGSWGIGRAWANRPSGIAITKVLRSAEIL